MDALDTAFCDRFGVDRPIVQAPIGSVSCPALAAAVSNAGGLGSLAVTWRDADATRRAIRETGRLTDHPFAVNLVLDEATTPVHPAEHLETCLDAGAPVVSFSFGEPGALLDRCADAGVPTIATVGSASMAESVVADGADCVVAQGWEAGGHLQSDVATLPLVPRVADAVPETPVLAAGGIADGRGLAAVLALGADGAWLGTRFVATEEAAAHARYKRAVSRATETDTLRSQLFDGGWPGRDHRTLRNETVTAWEDADRPSRGDRPGEGETVARTQSGDAVHRYDDLPPVEGLDGDVDALPQYAGQSAGLTGAVQPAGAVVEAIAEEARAAILDLREDRSTA
jgi:nitronate monooxygenase